MKHLKVVFESVKSSQIREVGHDKENETLYVRFRNGKMYSYALVSAETYKEFKSAESIGSYFHKNFKMNSELMIKQI